MTMPLNIDGLALACMSDEKLRALIAEMGPEAERDRRENQILFYEPASKYAAQIHQSQAKTIGAGGGNRSSKTETVLVEMVALATGVFPQNNRHWFAQKFRGPVRARIIVESLTTVLEPIILPKLRWMQWTGSDAPGGRLGHYGWIPRQSLVDFSWQKSYSTKTRSLRLLCRNPDNLDEVIGESLFQFMSYDQDSSDFASGTFHMIHHDEPPPLPIWTESQSRVLDNDGRLYLAMTWPDDPAISVDWLYDQVYLPGMPGPNKDPDIDWYELWTTDNVHLDQESVAKRISKWSNQKKAVRVRGAPLAFTNRIHGLFTDRDEWWSYAEGATVNPSYDDDGPYCPITGSKEVVKFNHVPEDLDDYIQMSWPAIFVMDPHPRKPHMFLWVLISPWDDLYVVAEGECDQDCAEVKAEVDKVELELGLRVAMRLMDPNMGRSVASTKREVTWQDEFDAVGLIMDLADNGGHGRKTINKMLEPDRATGRPQLQFHSRCKTTAHQMKRYVWADWKLAADRDQKQTPRDKNDDFPTMIKYLVNANPSFVSLNEGAPVIRNPNRGRRRGRRRGAP